MHASIINVRPRIDPALQETISALLRQLDSGDMAEKLDAARKLEKHALTEGARVIVQHIDILIAALGLKNDELTVLVLPILANIIDNLYFALFQAAEKKAGVMELAIALLWSGNEDVQGQAARVLGTLSL